MVFLLSSFFGNINSIFDSSGTAAADGAAGGAAFLRKQMQPKAFSFSRGAF